MEDLQDILGKQNFHENIENVFEPATDTIKKTSEELTETTRLTSKENNQAVEDLNDKLLEIMNDTGIGASFLFSLLSKIKNVEHTSRFKQVKDPSSNRVNELLKNKTSPVTLYNNFSRFRNIDKSLN